MDNGYTECDVSGPAQGRWRKYVVEAVGQGSLASSDRSVELIVAASPESLAVLRTLVASWLSATPANAPSGAGSAGS